MPLQLKSGENYGISVAAEGYLFQSENLDIPDDAEYNIVKRIVLKKLSKGSNIVLNNVFFDVAKATLRPTSINELDRLYNVLLSNPSMKIELSGHTDNQGSKVLNQKLSLARANAVVDYLISKGISGDRLVSKGYGYDKPVASNNTEEGRQLNRRTELKILEIN
jgi:outer membrane protein OmpA-like peptidoglycan-associated protein